MPERGDDTRTAGAAVRRRRAAADGIPRHDRALDEDRALCGQQTATRGGARSAVVVGDGGVDDRRGVSRAVGGAGTVCAIAPAVDAAAQVRGVIGDRRVLDDESPGGAVTIVLDPARVRPTTRRSVVVHQGMGDDQRALVVRDAASRLRAAAGDHVLAQGEVRLIADVAAEAAVAAIGCAAVDCERRNDHRRCAAEVDVLLDVEDARAGGCGVLIDTRTRTAGTGPGDRDALVDYERTVREAIDAGGDDDGVHRVGRARQPVLVLDQLPQRAAGWEIGAARPYARVGLILHRIRRRHRGRRRGEACDTGQHSHNRHQPAQSPASHPCPHATNKLATANGDIKQLCHRPNKRVGVTPRCHWWSGDVGLRCQII